jgi:tellurite resistance protein TerC
VLSLVFRAVFIFAGTAAIAAASWVFYILGGFWSTADPVGPEDTDESRDFPTTWRCGSLRWILADQRGLTPAAGWSPRGQGRMLTPW